MVSFEAASGAVSADVIVLTVVGDLVVTLPGVATGPFAQIDDVITFHLQRCQGRAPAKQDVAIGALGAVDHDPAFGDGDPGGVRVSHGSDVCGLVR